MGALPDTAKDFIVLLSELKDNGVMLGTVDLMVDLGDGNLVAAQIEYFRDEDTSAKWIVVSPKPVGTDAG